MNFAWKDLGHTEVGLYVGQALVGSVWRRFATLDRNIGEWKALLTHPYGWEGTFPTEAAAKDGLELVARHALATDAAARLGEATFYDVNWQEIGHQLRALGCVEARVRR
jgi:hypothetical protein